jgi:hypothetical protein
MRSSVQGGAALWWAILDGFGSYGSRAMWRVCCAYLEVAVVSEGGRWWRPSLLKLGRWCGAVSGVPRATGKTRMGAADSGDPY